MQDGVGQFVPEGVADLGGLEGATGAVAAPGDLDDRLLVKNTRPILPLLGMVSSISTSYHFNPTLIFFGISTG